MPKPIVFVIEDDPNLNQIFTISLENDFSVESFSDGTSALARLSEVVPTIVILDLNLPGVSGAEILTHIRSDQRLSDTRVILATADDQQALMLDNKADMALLKPISPSQLRELVKRLWAGAADSESTR